jgi:hypothetical protein
VTIGTPWAPPKLAGRATELTKLDPPAPPAPLEPPKHKLGLQISFPEAPPPPPK